TRSLWRAWLLDYEPSILYFKGGLELKSLIKFVASIVLLCALAPCIYSQQAATATLSGTITDPNGAVLIGAQVTATQKTTGVGHVTTTNYDGLYVLTNLPPGEYEVKVQAKGFATQVSQSPVVLQVGQTIKLDTT